MPHHLRPTVLHGGAQGRRGPAWNPPGAGNLNASSSSVCGLPTHLHTHSPHPAEPQFLEHLSAPQGPWLLTHRQDPSWQPVTAPPLLWGCNSGRREVSRARGEVRSLVGDTHREARACSSPGCGCASTWGWASCSSAQQEGFQDGGGRMERTQVPDGHGGAGRWTSCQVGLWVEWASSSWQPKAPDRPTSPPLQRPCVVCAPTSLV